jgi:hypothetical protein
MRVNIAATVLRFVHAHSTGNCNWWLIVQGNETDLCKLDPGFYVDLYVWTNLRTMTAIWMGVTAIDAEVSAGRLRLTGDPALKTRMQQWLRLSPFAAEKKQIGM